MSKANRAICYGDGGAPSNRFLREAGIVKKAEPFRKWLKRVKRKYGRNK